jgi:holo-[acyl-carrier protein] synthase
MNEKAKEIVASFLKVAPGTVTVSTIIDNNALHSSVLIHRMYATLSKEGVKISDPHDIRTFGDLLDALGNGDGGGTEGSKGALEPRPSTPDLSARGNSTGLGAGLLIGVDIEDVDNMPKADDYREDEFYSLNFSEREISYCILQPEIQMSFAGKFAAKEAIVKADNSLKGVPFKDIEILNDGNGRPYFGDLAISISHTEQHAVAIAVKGGGMDRHDGPVSMDQVKGLIDAGLSKAATGSASTGKLSTVAILISLGAICLAILALLF